MFSFDDPGDSSSSSAQARVGLVGMKKMMIQKKDSEKQNYLMEYLTHPHLSAMSLLHGGETEEDAERRSREREDVAATSGASSQSRKKRLAKRDGFAKEVDSTKKKRKSVASSSSGGNSSAPRLAAPLSEGPLDDASSSRGSASCPTASNSPPAPQWNMSTECDLSIALLNGQSVAMLCSSSALSFVRECPALWQRILEMDAELQQMVRDWHSFPQSLPCAPLPMQQDSSSSSQLSHLQWRKESLYRVLHTTPPTLPPGSPSSSFASISSALHVTSPVAVYHKLAVERLCAKFFENALLVRMLGKARTNDIVHQRTKLKALILSRLLSEFLLRVALPAQRAFSGSGDSESADSHVFATAGGMNMGIGCVDAAGSECDGDRNSSAVCHGNRQVDGDSGEQKTVTTEEKIQCDSIVNAAKESQETRCAYTLKDFSDEFPVLYEKYRGSLDVSLLPHVLVLRSALCVFEYETKEVPALAAQLLCASLLSSNLPADWPATMSLAVSGEDTGEPFLTGVLPSSPLPTAPVSTPNVVKFAELRRELCERIAEMSAQFRKDRVLVASTHIA